MVKERNLSIELLKFIAVIIVANSHMELLYGNYGFLASGGAIGDSLFFFASGFTLFLGRGGNFVNWYKRRISRIYPSIFAWAFLAAIIGFKTFDIVEIVLGGGCWFVTCIMLYYIFLYFVKKHAEFRPAYPFCIACAIVLIWYFYEDKSTFFMYGYTYFRWGHFFLFMLLGAYIGNNTIPVKLRPKTDVFLFFASLCVFYGMFICGTVFRIQIINNIQILSLLPLMGVSFYLYKICCCERIKLLMTTKIGLCMRFVAGLCLEAILVQPFLFTDKMNFLFPLNIPIMFVYIIVVAYITRMLGRIFLQVFQKEDFCMKEVIKLID